MAASNMNPKVDAFIARQTQWKPEMEKLRAISLNSGLEEAVKWGKPCYTLDDANVVLIQGFKAYCALLFMKGALVEDPDHILVKVGENSRIARQARFTDVAGIEAIESSLIAAIESAIAVERSGEQVDLAATDDVVAPEEFQIAIDADPALRSAFEALTPGRQRAYLLHFNGARQSKTRTSRVDVCIPRILDGLGLND